MIFHVFPHLVHWFSQRTKPPLMCGDFPLMSSIPIRSPMKKAPRSKQLMFHSFLVIFMFDDMVPCSKQSMFHFQLKNSHVTRWYFPWEITTFFSHLPALRQVGSFTMSGGGGMPPQIRSMISALTGQREDGAKASANVGETTGKDRGEAITEVMC